MDWCNTFMFANKWLSGTELLVYICQRTELKKAIEQALPIPGAVSLPQIFIKMHNRGHIPAATQVVMFNGYFRDSDKYP